VRVVDFSTHLSGPMASHLLAETGVDVIKIEHPVIGDGNRGMSPKINGIGDFHVGLNSGVRSLAASTHSANWPRLLEACAKWADAIIVGSRPSDARRRGLDFATLSAYNDRLVYTAISGYGLRGPWQEFPAHGQNVDAWAGQVPVVESDGRLVTGSGWRSAGTTLAGVFAALGTLAAVQKRDEVGAPQFVHVSLWQSAMWWKWRDINDLANLGHQWPDYRDLGPRYSIYKTADGRPLLVCPLEEKFWNRFADLIGLEPDELQRGTWNKANSGMDYGYDGEYELIAAKLLTRPRDAWAADLERLEIPFASVLDVAEAMNSDHASANDLLRTTTVNGQTARVVASPVQMHLDVDGNVTTPLGDLSSPPEIGEQSAEILKEIGLDFGPDEIRN
jgi:crotonobetainyl-CoA:carnitine CoA-transferase CaiB-like acyl-CoA transferase